MLVAGHKWREKVEAILAATPGQVIDFSTLMPQHAVALFSFVVTGVNNGMGGTGVTKYLSKLGTGTWLDMLVIEVRCLFEFIYSRYGGDVPAAGALNWVMPLHLLNLLIPDLAVGGVMPEVGLPSNSDKIFQFFMDGVNASAGTAILGWIKSYREPTHIPYLQGHAVTGLAAGTNNQNYKLPWQPLPTAGFVTSFGATTFTRIRLYAPNEQGVVEEIFDTKREQLLALPLPYSDLSIVDPIYLNFGRTIIIRPGSYLLVDGGAGIDGTQRFVPVQFIPVGEKIQGLPNAGAK
jgi:hypothetical protein